MIIRCSSLPVLMTNPRNKGDREAGNLSQTAKSEIEKLVKEELFGFKSFFSTKETKKGIECEDAAIELYNSVFFTDYKKNTERRTDEVITGECDVDAPDEIIDMKCPWSKKTFPACPYNIPIKDYEMQLRGYMKLWDKPKATVCYCLMDTPIHLIPNWESDELHEMGNVEEQLRITKLTIYRDAEKEQMIIDKVNKATEHANWYRNEILLKSESYFQ